jgi:hypothetical protein
MIYIEQLGKAIKRGLTIWYRLSTLGIKKERFYLSAGVVSDQ